MREKEDSISSWGATLFIALVILFMFLFWGCGLSGPVNPMPHTFDIAHRYDTFVDYRDARGYTLIERLYIVPLEDGDIFVPIIDGEKAPGWWCPYPGFAVSTHRFDVGGRDEVVIERRHDLNEGNPWTGVIWEQKKWQR